MDNDIDSAAKDLGAALICGAAYEISMNSDNSTCVLLFYGTAYGNYQKESFDYVVLYILPIVLTLGSLYYMVKEMAIHVHTFLHREKKKAVFKLHETTITNNT